MTDQHYFETTDRAILQPRRFRARFPKNRSQGEDRKQREIQTNRRAAVQIRAMIAKLDHDASSLDDSINAILEDARVRDPSHYAYPISVTTMTARRENLKATIAVLVERLAKLDQASKVAA
jgi:hypothetical protein